MLHIFSILAALLRDDVSQCSECGSGGDYRSGITRINSCLQVVM